MIDWLFRDRRTGAITVAQFPNAALWTFLAASLVGRLTEGHGTVDTAARHTATAALAWWAVDEVVRGVNPWRRVLGAGGLVLVALRVIGSG